MNPQAHGFGWLHRFSLRAWLAIGFNSVIALALVAAAGSWLTQERFVDAFHRLLAVDGRIATLSLGSNVEMLRARRAEKDFLIYRREFGFDEAKSRYVTLLRTALAEIRQNMAEIRNLTAEPEAIEQTREIERAVTRYEAGFLASVELHGVLGHFTTGLEGRFRAKAHEIESIVGAGDRLTADLLALRRHEKDFILRGLDRDVGAFEQGLERLKADVALARFTPEKSEALVRLANEYLGLFLQYVQTETRIDEEEAAYLAAAHTVEPVLQKLQIEAHRREIATRADAERVGRIATWTICGLALLALFFGVTVARRVARLITEAVDECLQFAKRVAQGDLLARLAPRGRHEFGSLAAALNDMTAALQGREAGLQRAGEQVRESEERYRDLVEHSHDLVCTHDLDGNLLSVNKAGVRLSGYPREVLLGMNLADLLVPAVRASFPAYLAEIRTRGAASGLMRVQTASGDERWWEYDNTLRTEGVAVPIVRGTSHDVTERMRAEKGLRESEAKLRAIFENAVEGIFLVDGGGRVVSANPMLAHMLGYESAQQMAGEIRSVARDVYAENGARRRFRELLGAHGVVEDFETRWRRKDGSTFWVSLSGRVIARETGGAIHHLGMARDITERKRASVELEKLSLAVRQSGTGIVITDPAGTIEFVNPKFESMTGYSAAEVLGRKPNLLKSGTTPQEVYRELWAAIRAGKQWQGELQNRKKSGELYWEKQHISPVLDAAGTVQHFVAVKEDVTELKRADETLRESELRFRQLAENIHEVFFLVDPANTQVLYVSPAYETIWGRSCASLYDNPDSWTDLIHPGDRKRVLANLERAAQTGEVNQEYRIVRADCTTRWIRVRGFPIRNEAGELYRIAGVAEDITERKGAEDKIARLNRVYAVLSAINALIVRVRDRDGLLRGACEIAVQAGGFKSAWVGMLDHETRDLRTVAQAGACLEGLATARQSAKDGLPAGRGVMGRALRERVPQIVNDAFSDDRLAYRTEALASGFRSFAVLPLLANGAPVGVLSLLSGEVGFFDEEEVRLLRELGGDIGFALESIAKNQQLDYLAYYDPLTGLANRALLQERLSQRLGNGGSGTGKLALALVDIERLKTVNDSLGRQGGDELLRQFARCMVGAAAPARVARVSADQFAVILPDVSGKSDAARQVEEMARKCVAHPFVLNGVEVRISAKLGVAIYPNHAGDAETLLRNAEAALRKAKDTGERHAFYTSDLTAAASQTLTLESKLRQALERDEFVLHYQPKVDVATGRIAGVEALIRWSNPELGLVPPSEFIPLLESTGLIQEAGSWALRKAIEDHQRWLQMGLAAPRVAVNVSAMQLRGRDYVASVQQAIAQGANPTGIDLEITESLAMRDVEGNIEKLRTLRALGVSIAIDDFGTGYSSLGYLAKLPVQTLKIDRSFIITMLDDPNTMSLVSTMISLAHSLRLKVVAEGVDSEEQAKFLRLLRCDEMQGYLFAKPLPFEQMTALLQREIETQPAQEAFA